MKYSIAVYCILITAAVYAQGFLVDEYQQHKCNLNLESRLNLIRIRYHDMYHNILPLAGGPTCKECAMSNFDTIKRTGHVLFRKTSDDRVSYKMKLGFTDLKILCNCNSQTGNSQTGNSQTGSFEGNKILRTWPQFQFTATFEVNPARGLASFTHANIDDWHQQRMVKCTGVPAWIKFCEGIRLSNEFHYQLKDVVKLFIASKIVDNVMHTFNCVK